MKIYTKYLTLYFLKVFSIILGALTLLALLLQVTLLISSSSEILYAGVLYILKSALFRVPSILIYTTPIALCCAVVSSIKLMHSENELLILELSGATKFDIAKPFITILLVITFLSLMIGFFINPIYKKRLLEQREEVQKNVLNSLVKEKVFTKISNILMLYIDEKVNSKDLKGVIIYDNTDSAGSATILAKSAKVSYNDNKVIFKLFDGSRQVLNKGEFQVLNFKTWLFDMSEYSKKLLWNFSGNLDIKSIFELFKHSSQTKASKSYHTKLKQEINRRFSWPLFNLSLPLLFLFNALYMGYSRQSRINYIKFSLTLSILNVLLYFIFMNRIGNGAVYSFAIYALQILFCTLGVYLPQIMTFQNKLFWKGKS